MQYTLFGTLQGTVNVSRIRSVLLIRYLIILLLDSVGLPLLAGNRLVCRGNMCAS